MYYKDNIYMSEKKASVMTDMKNEAQYDMWLDLTLLLSVRSHISDLKRS